MRWRLAFRSEVGGRWVHSEWGSGWGAWEVSYSRQYVAARGGGQRRLGSVRVAHLGVKSTDATKPGKGLYRDVSGVL